MRLAALDIGSNTVHILVADVVRGRLEEDARYVEMPERAPLSEVAWRPRPQPAHEGGGLPPRPRGARSHELRGAAAGGGDRLAARGGPASNLPLLLPKRNPPAGRTAADLLECGKRLDGEP